MMPSSDVENARPLYQQVKNHILGKIRSNTWSPLSRLPSENELVRSFKVSRMTVNRALRELMHEGFITRVHGVGSFVKELPQQTSLLELKNIADEIAERGNTHSSVVIKRGEIEASVDQATPFSLSPGAKLYHITIVHFENDIPVEIEDRLVNPLIAPDFLKQDFGKQTPTHFLLSVAPVSELEHTVSAILPDNTQQQLLDVTAHDPCLMLTRRSWTGRQVATLATLTYPANRYSLRSRYKTSPMGTLLQNGFAEQTTKTSKPPTIEAS